MEPREHLHQLVDALPDTALEAATQVLVSLQGQSVQEKHSLRVADLGWTPAQAADTRARLAEKCFASDTR